MEDKYKKLTLIRVMSCEKKGKMKTRNLKIWTGVVAALIAMMNLVPVVSAAESADITVTVTVSYLSLTYSGNWSIGAVKTNSVTNSSNISVINDGNWPINLTLKQTVPSGWAINTTINGVNNNTYVLAANFTDNSPGISGFTDASVITASEQTAVNKFGAPSNGLNIAASASKNLWLLFKAPTTNTQKNQQNITVTVGAVAA